MPHSSRFARPSPSAGFAARPCAALLALTLALATQARAGVRLPAVFADHMVLQRESEVALWGWSGPGAKLEITGDFLPQPIACTADASGAFRTKLRTGAAGGPHKLTLRELGTHDGARELGDVWVGVVWLCGGQSNMEWPLGAVDGYPGIRDWQAEAKNANLPQIRFFDVPNVVSAGPESDCKGEWKICTSESALHFSAVGFLFGREIQHELGVPVGLIGVNWGGTPAEAWTSAEGLAGFPRYQQDLAWLATLRKDPEGAARKHDAELAQWFAALGDDVGAQGGNAEERTNRSDLPVPAGWKSMDQPQRWGGELADFDGVVTLARRFTLSENLVGRDLVVELGAIDDMDTTWFDGTRIGGLEREGLWQVARAYRVPAKLATAGVHELRVRVVDTGGYGGIVCKPEELRIHVEGDDARAQPLAGPWGYRVGKRMDELAPYPSTSTLGPNTATTLYNGLIAPVVPFGIRGALFYQGEANRYDARGYRSLFPAMIADWRAHFGQGDFPFYFVQIAPFGYGDYLGSSGFLRDAQLATMQSVPATGMVVTMDIGDPGNIHPVNKQDVGHRLALWALARTYGRKELECCGPVFARATVEGRAIRVAFEHGKGLHARGGAPTQFQLAGKDGAWVPAEARIENDGVVLQSAKLAEPLYVRYAWCEACETNLYNGAELPAAPFRTDPFEN